MISAPTEKRPRRNEKGSALIEFVLLAPLMVLLLMFVLFAGWWSYSKLSSQNAAYSRGVSNTAYANFHSGGQYIPEEESAEWVILESSQGMKQMWADHMSIGWSHHNYFTSRIGGSGYTVMVSPSEIPVFTSIFDFIHFVVNENTSNQLPKGNAFFFFTPLISESASEY